MSGGGQRSLLKQFRRSGIAFSLAYVSLSAGTGALILFGAVALSSAHLAPFGMALALISGVITSGLGYVLWYKALRELSTTQASVAQLLVPVLAAFGGVVFLSERMSVRLVVASALILGGVALALLKRDFGAGSRLS